MNYTVVGVSKVKRGVFEGREWEHRKLHVMREPFPAEEVIGMVTEIHKLKTPFYSILDSLKYGDTVDIQFSASGYLQTLVKVNK